MIDIRGVSLRWLLGLDLGNWNSEDVLQHFVAPLVKEKKISVVNHLAVEQPELVKEKADVFISYTWATPTRFVLDAVSEEMMKDEDLFVWMDLLCINQFVYSGFSSEFLHTSFHDAIGTIGKLIFVIHPWNQPHALTRCWCIWELYGALRKCGKEGVSMGIPPKELESFRHALLHSRESIVSSFGEIDSANADSTMAEDKELIMAAIKNQPGGFGRINEEVLSFLRTWILEKLKQELKPLRISEGETDEKHFQLIENAGKLVMEFGKHEAAVEYYKALVRMHEMRNSSKGALGLAKILYSDALSNFKERREEVLRLDREGLTLVREACGDNQYDSDLAKALFYTAGHCLGTFIFGFGGEEILLESKSYHKECIEILEHLQNNSSMLASAINNLGEVERNLGNLDAARECFERTLEIRCNISPSLRDPKIGYIKHNLAILDLLQGKTERAHKKREEALDIFRHVFGDDPSANSALTWQESNRNWEFAMTHVQKQNVSSNS